MTEIGSEVDMEDKAKKAWSDLSTTDLEELEQLKKDIAEYLATVGRYNVANLDKFELYVEHQAKQNFYDLEANLAVLKLYQFYPENYKSSVVEVILLKALGNLPHNDFALCRCLLGGRQFDDAVIHQLSNFADILEACQFRTFWIEKEKNLELFNRICGFDNCIRKFICHVVSHTYQNVKKSLLKEILGKIDEDEIKSLVKDSGWEEKEPDIIYIPGTQERVKSTNIFEKIKFEEFSLIEFSGDGIKTGGGESVQGTVKVYHKTLPNLQTQTQHVSDDKRIQEEETSASALGRTYEKDSSLRERFYVNPNFDANIDPDDFETKIRDTPISPSNETEFDWIYVSNKRKIARENPGKWLIFEPWNKIDETWKKISKAVQNDELGCSAKVATAKDMDIRSPYKNQSVICVYTYDHEDEYDVMRVRAALRRMGFDQKLSYKTDEATLAGQYRWKTGTRVSKYYL